MKANKVFWTPLAVQSLKETKTFILEHWNENVLNAFVQLIDQRIGQVLNNPEIAPIVGRMVYRKLVIHRNISVFYTIEPEWIKIVLVWDNRQNPRRLKEALTGL